MMLADLLVALETQGALPRSRIPAITTNLTYFASALGYPSLAQCPVAACGDPATWLVTGTDGAGVEAAVGLLRTDSLAHRYAIASAGGHEIPLPEGG